MQDVDRYKSISPIQHVKLRKSMYVGDCSVGEDNLYTWDAPSSTMVLKSVVVCPGLEKLMYEAIDNATDNTHRTPPTTVIRVMMTDTTFSCSNNGVHIPVQKKADKWVPSTIFTEMHSGSNFDDTTHGRVAAGMNGLGIKLSAILSDSFTVTCFDPVAKLLFSQRTTNGLEVILPPEVKSRTVSPMKGRMTTCVEFTPTLSHFGIKSLAEFRDRIQTRLVQLSATFGGKVKFFFNDEVIQLKSFKSFIRSFPFEGTTYECINDRMEYGFGLSPVEEYKHFSFVNHLYTDEGGTHTKCIESQIISAILEHFDKKTKSGGGSIRLSRPNVKNRIVVFCSVHMTNPEFKSQAKRFLSSPIPSSAYALSRDAIIRHARKIGLLDQLKVLLSVKEKTALGDALSSKKARTVRIENLTDAVYAGTVRSTVCSLFVVEGLSAKTFAISGLPSVRNPKSYGVYPVKGKPLNTYNATHKNITKNKEIADLCKILGLVVGRDYSGHAALATLRYRHMVILTDADVDGYHICGLLLAFIYRFFPTLLQNGFVKRFVTPIIIASHRSAHHEFFSVPEYNKWSSLQPDVSKYNIKYFKGLGSSTQLQAKRYFANLSSYLKPMVVDETTHSRIALLFDAKQADNRKRWMVETEQHTLDYTLPSIDITDFVDTEMHEFSMETLTRAIPGIDGLKESQRKVLYATMKKCSSTNNKEIKIAQLGAFAAEITAYTHGEKSIQDTCNKMTHSFVGSNNLPLLEACGNTGSRLHLGADAASTRYTFTRLLPYTTMIFNPLDESILQRRVEEGMQIEYTTYEPIVPVILINGCMGIATGYRTNIPCHDPGVIIRQLLDRLRKRTNSFTELHPSYNGWKGRCTSTDSEWVFTGVVDRENMKCRITELPIMISTEKYKTKVLYPLVEKKQITNLVESHADENSVCFEFTILSCAFSDKKLDLSTTMSKKCINLLVDGTLMHFNTTTDIMELFYHRRLAVYGKRREFLLHSMKTRRDELLHKQSFISHVIDDTIQIRRTTKEMIIVQSCSFGIPRQLAESFVNMSFLSLTKKRIDELSASIRGLDIDIDSMLTSTPSSLWMGELESLYLHLYPRNTKRKRLE